MLSGTSHTGILKPPGHFLFDRNKPIPSDSRCGKIFEATKVPKAGIANPRRDDKAWVYKPRFIRSEFVEVVLTRDPKALVMQQALNVLDDKIQPDEYQKQKQELDNYVNAECERYFQCALLDTNIEVLTQEWFRLIIPGQPKTRMSVEDGCDIYISSELITHKKITKSIQAEINSGEYFGLGLILVCAIVLGEIDLNPQNLLIGPHGQLIKIDGDAGFGTLILDYENRLPITSSDLDRLLHVMNYHPANWLDNFIKMQDEDGEDYYEPNRAPPAYRMLPQDFDLDEKLLRERNFGLLRQLILPDEWVKVFVSHYVADLNEQEKLYNVLIQRRESARAAILQRANFREFLLNDKTWKLVEEDTAYYLDYLSSFKTVHSQLFVSQILDPDRPAKDPQGNKWHTVSDTAKEQMKQMASNTLAAFRQEATVVEDKVRLAESALHAAKILEDKIRLAESVTKQATPSSVSFLGRMRPQLKGFCIGLGVAGTFILGFFLLRLLDVITFGGSLPVTIPASVILASAMATLGTYLGDRWGRTLPPADGTPVVTNSEAETKPLIEESPQPAPTLTAAKDLHADPQTQPENDTTVIVTEPELSEEKQLTDIMQQTTLLTSPVDGNVLPIEIPPRASSVPPPAMTSTNSKAAPPHGVPGNVPRNISSPGLIREALKAKKGDSIATTTLSTPVATLTGPLSRQETGEMKGTGEIIFPPLFTSNPNLTAAGGVLTVSPLIPIDKKREITTDNKRERADTSEDGSRPKSPLSPNPSKPALKHANSCTL